ncbi:MAG: hypothetical protein PVJ67_06235 [Candidatus Pacearchaeota archaeon]|jgi:hypothetical protein
MIKETLVFIDDGFLSKLNKYFGNGRYIKYSKLQFSRNISKKQKMHCKHVFFYTAPPFISQPPKKEEVSLKKSYDKFIKKLDKNKEVTIREV